MGAIVAVFLALTGWQWRLASRLSNAETSAEQGARLAAEADARADILERRLNEHQVYSAREYANRENLAALENKLIEAINRLGDRLDNAFMHREVR